SDRRHQGQRRAPPAGVRRAAGGVRPQPRDGPADLQADPSRIPLRALAGRDLDGQGRGHDHQVQPHPRDGRDRRRDPRVDAAPAGCGLRHPHDHPVHAPVEAASPDRPLGQAPAVRGALHRRRGDGLPRRHGRADGPLLLPRRQALGSGDAQARPCDPREPPPPRFESARPSGSRERRRPHPAARRELTPAPERTPSHMARTPETKPEKGSKKKQKLNPDGTPKKGRIKQIIEVYKYTQEVDRTTLPWMIGAIAAAIVLGVLVSALVLNSPWYGIFMGLAIGILVAMMILARKAERAAFGRIKGQPGAALAAMQSIRRGWNVDDEPVQIDPRSQKMLFRASGRAG